MAQTVKSLPATQQTRVLPLSQEDPLEKGMASHSSVLAWRSPCTEDPGGLQSMGGREVRVTERLARTLAHVPVSGLGFAQAPSVAVNRL